MKKLLASGMFALLLLTFSASAFADDDNWRYRNDNRYGFQDRLQNGWLNGSLTRNEIRNLTNNQCQIKNKAALFRSDGQLSNRERARLKQMRHWQSKRIYGQKHDWQNRFRRG